MERDNFVLGDSKACCDVCGFDFKQSQLRKRWDGAMVCKADYEPRHQQDFVKARPERSIVKDARPGAEPRFVEANEITGADL
jgi:hypothetical protein